MQGTLEECLQSFKQWLEYFKSVVASLQNTNEAAWTTWYEQNSVDGNTLCGHVGSVLFSHASWLSGRLVHGLVLSLRAGDVTEAAFSEPKAT
jgi:hypothetical protein